MCIFVSSKYSVQNVFFSPLTGETFLNHLTDSTCLLESSLKMRAVAKEMFWILSPLSIWTRMPTATSVRRQIKVKSPIQYWQTTSNLDWKSETVLTLSHLSICQKVWRQIRMRGERETSWTLSLLSIWQKMIRTPTGTKEKTKMNWSRKQLGKNKKYIFWVLCHWEKCLLIF